MGHKVRIRKVTHWHGSLHQTQTTCWHAICACRWSLCCDFAKERSSNNAWKTVMQITRIHVSLCKLVREVVTIE